MTNHVGLPPKSFDDVRASIIEAAWEYAEQMHEQGLIRKSRIPEIAVQRAVTAALQTGVTCGAMAAHENGAHSTAAALLSWLPKDMGGSTKSGTRAEVSRANIIVI